MPKPIIKSDQSTIQQISLYKESSIQSDMNPLLIEKRLRQKRSSRYMEAMKQLDLSHNKMDSSNFHEVRDILYQEFSDIVKPEPDTNIQEDTPGIYIGEMLLGIVAKCYLGFSYEVHTLDFTGDIVDHYKKSEKLPNSLDRARGLALHGGYAFVEVYTNSLRAIKADGSVTVALK